MKAYRANLFRRTHARLAEGPVWQGDALWFVDILKGALHRLSDSGDADTKWQLGKFLSAAVPAGDGRWIVARQHDIAWFDPTQSSVQTFAALKNEPPEARRFNDGKCDSAGRLWIGTMALTDAQRGCTLYRVDGDATFAPMVKNVTISNGLGWSPDDRWMYYVDSVTRRIDRFEFAAASGALSRRKTLAEFAAHEGLPDGLTLDEEGHLWVAMWGGSRAWHIHGETGERLGYIELPVSNVTSCTFGGPKLRTLFITTASDGLDAAALAAQPMAGGIFACEADVGGFPAQHFRPA